MEIFFMDQNVKQTQACQFCWPKTQGLQAIIALNEESQQPVWH